MNIITETINHFQPQDRPFPLQKLPLGASPAPKQPAPATPSKVRHKNPKTPIPLARNKEHERHDRQRDRAHNP